MLLNAGDIVNKAGDRRAGDGGIAISQGWSIVRNRLTGKKFVASMAMPTGQALSFLPRITLFLNGGEFTGWQGGYDAQKND
jgi:hypothetical protein